MENENPQLQMQNPRIYVEKTLIIIKPDAMKHKEKIENFILNKGFTILKKRHLHLSPEIAADFYIEHHGKMFFTELVAYMSSAPIMIFCVARHRAISLWLELMGPASPCNGDGLRSKYGINKIQNALHGSDSYSSACREIRFIFADSIIEPISVGQSCKDYVNKEIMTTLLKGLTALCKEKPRDPLEWLADWLTENNPNKPQIENPIVINPLSRVPHLFSIFFFAACSVGCLFL